jgi:hypothetical protein
MKGESDENRMGRDLKRSDPNAIIEASEQPVAGELHSADHQNLGKESSALQQDASLLPSFRRGGIEGTSGQAHHQHAEIQLLDALAASHVESRQYERQRSMTIPWEQSQGNSTDHPTHAQVSAIELIEAKQPIDGSSRNERFSDYIRPTLTEVLSGPSEIPRPTDSTLVSRSLVSREISPANSIVQDARGDIEYAVSSDDSSSTDQSSDEDMEMQDAHHERPEEPSMGILPEAPPATQQREETRETEVTLLNEPAPTSSPGLSLDELLSSAAALYETDEADSSSINKPIPQRRNRYRRIQMTEDEKKHGCNFVRDQRASKASWDQITLEYNREFGVDRTKQHLQSQFDRWRLKHGVKK